MMTLGATHYPDQFLQVVVDGASRKVRLDLARPGEARDALLAVAGDVPVDTRSVRYSYAERMALVEQIVRDAGSWDAIGTYITAVLPEPNSDLVQIGLKELTPASATALTTRYGSDRVRVTQRASAVPGTRFADSNTYKSGGIKLDGQGVGSCTAGFGIHQGSTPATTSTLMLTAGHCFPNDTVVNHNGVFQGRAVRTSTLYTNNGWDIEYVEMKSAHRIWETDDLLARSDGAVAYSPSGVTVCHSGIATNKKCGTTDVVSGCYTQPPEDGGLRLCRQTSVVSSTGAYISAKGDSGGPAFTASAFTTPTTRYFAGVGIFSNIINPELCVTERGFENVCGNGFTYTEMYWLYQKTGWWPNY